MNVPVGTVVGGDVGDRCLLRCSCGLDSLTLASAHWSFACQDYVMILSRCGLGFWDS